MTSLPIQLQSTPETPHETERRHMARAILKAFAGADAGDKAAFDAAEAAIIDFGEAMYQEGLCEGATIAAMKATL